MDQMKSLTQMGSAEKKPIAAKVLAQAERLAGLAKSVSEMTGRKLAPIMGVANDPAAPVAPKDKTAYPPLFAEMREQLEIMERALLDIEEYIGRAEV